MEEELREGYNQSMIINGKVFRAENFIMVYESDANTKTGKRIYKSNNSRFEKWFVVYKNVTSYNVIYYEAKKISKRKAMKIIADSDIDDYVKIFGIKKFWR
jgi:hypothetical protein